jgi:8-oxo-dGTP diphosphatase
VRAAGGVVVRGKGDDTEFLLAHRPRYDDWSLPKGKLDNGESFKAGALREIKEETGFDTAPLAMVGAIAYETPNGNGKVVRYWLLRAGDGKFRANPEVDLIGWFPMKKAWKRLSYSRDREVLEWAAQLNARPTAARVFLVRHSHAGRRREWAGDDLLRPLSKVGLKQTAALQDMLTRNPVTRVYSSPSARCTQTVEPIARALQLRVRSDDSLLEGHTPEELADFLASQTGESVVACSHGDVVAAYLQLVKDEGAKIDGPMRWAKGSVWVLELVNGRVRRARYLPPPL